MKLVAVLAASLLALTVVTTHAQTQGLNGREAFQVKKNVLIKDAAGAKLGVHPIEELKLWEDGTEQNITALSANSAPLYLAIVMDDSGSMGRRREHLTAIAKYIVEGLETGSHVQIVRFGGAERIRVANDWTAEKPVLISTIDEIPLGAGNSPIIDGVRTALDQIKAAVPGDKRFAIVLISDCEENGSMSGPNELLGQLIKADVPLFTVSLVDKLTRPSLADQRYAAFMKRHENFPHDSALATGGSVYFPLLGENARLPLSESLKALADELQAQFVLTYTPANQARDGKERKLRIEAAETYDGKPTATIKETFVVALAK